MGLVNEIIPLFYFNGRQPCRFFVLALKCKKAKRI